jgi:hypothetical protein
MDIIYTLLSTGYQNTSIRPKETDAIYSFDYFVLALNNTCDEINIRQMKAIQIKKGKRMQQRLTLGLALGAPVPVQMRNQTYQSNAFQSQSFMRPAFGASEKPSKPDAENKAASSDQTKTPQTKSPTKKSSFWKKAFWIGLGTLGLGAVGTGAFVYAHKTVITQTQANTTLSSDDYQRQTALQKQAKLWQELVKGKYQVLPATNSQGVTGGQGLEPLKNLCKLFDKGYMKETFDKASDVRPPHNKLFHPFGSVATVSFEPEGQADAFLTGMFNSPSVGIARLSLAASDSPDQYSPGIALKLFVDGKPSVNIMAIPSLSGQKSRDFFERTPTTRFPAPKGFIPEAVSGLIARKAEVKKANELGVQHFAEVTPTGKQVLYPSIPYVLEFRPKGVHFDKASQNDFREDLATIPVGTVIYEVWGKMNNDPDEAPFKIGNIKTSSPFVASKFGDQELNFQHPRH